jgi:quinol monooxygenase YgiN
MLGIVAKIRVKDGMGEQFEEVAGRLVAAVNDNEPGCLLYALHRSDDPNLYVFMERYQDDAAAEAHRKSDHFRGIGREMGAFMDGAPEIMRLQQV